MFYTAVQNNSGGQYIINDDVSYFVIIEANSPEEANNILNNITKNYRRYCSCCGERWQFDFDEEDGDNVPMIFGDPVSEVQKDSCVEECIIYYLDGRKEKIIFK